MTASKHLRSEVFVCLFLALMTTAPYWQLLTHEFINLDDPIFVTENRLLHNAFTRESITWAFSFTDVTYWQPLTWLSHMLDCWLYGLRPGMHLLTNLLFHIANTMLLFLVYNKMTGSLWRSTFVAALFALHPLNVDSVAWVSNRKTLLSTFFWMLTMLSYVYYSKDPGFRRYLLVLMCFVMGLMAKSTVVVLPFVLLLLDYWPLRRFSLEESNKHSVKKVRKSIASADQGSLIFRLIPEKAPLLILSATSVCLSYLRPGGSVVSTESVPMKLRIANAIISYVNYIWKMIWPHDLAVFYPYPKAIPMWKTTAALFLLLLVSALAIKAWRKKPYFGTGWLWYLGTLLPVAGLMQIGLWPAMADRFVYVPLIGIFIIIAWGVPELVEHWGLKKTGLVAIGTALLSILMAITFLQIRYWNNSITLFKHAIDATENNYLAYNNLGVALYGKGKTEAALWHYSEALRIRPKYADAHNNMGNVLVKQNKIEEAIKHYFKALQINPNFEIAHNNIGNALSKLNRTTEAIQHISMALQINPDYANAHNNLAAILMNMGENDKAITHYLKALRIDPDSAEAHNNLGVALINKGEIDKAIKHYTSALEINPEGAEIHDNLGNAFMRKGKIDEAVRQYQKALSIKPDFIHALFNLAKAYSIKGEYGKVVSTCNKVIELQPDVSSAYYHIASAYARQNRIDDAIDWLKKAVNRGYDKWDFIKNDKNLESIRNSSYYRKLTEGR